MPINIGELFLKIGDLLKSGHSKSQKNDPNKCLRKISAQQPTRILNMVKESQRHTLKYRVDHWRR